MASKLPLVAISLGFCAVFWQLVLRDAFFNGMGLGRKVQPVTDFPYQCHRISGDPNIQACEDMWLDQRSRTLYLACSDSLARKEWMPNKPVKRDASIHRLNASGRALHDHVVAMDIDSPKASGGYTYRVLKMQNFPGVHGDGRLHVVGMTGTTSADGFDIQLWLVNARPSVDPETGELLDNSVVGGNSTIEVFATTPGSNSMNHVKTYADAQIATPNNVAVTQDGGFFFTNDHGPHKVGLQHHLSSFIGTGDVSYCSATGVCKKVASGFKFPNGLHLGSDGLLYVPSAAVGGITVFKPSQDGSVVRVHKIDLDYPIDNFSEDANGDIFAATLPKALQALAAFEDPLNPKSAPATVWRVRRLNREVGDQYQYELTKIIEDAEGEVLPGMTTAIHDAQTGRLFMSGVVSPFITVCNRV
ncbi:SMP-30/Gluconolaconase/LRE-like domain-containing protein [Cladophialophora immunda]|nr:SMP-30/Gluconolaconase/LRE-like domain-containing protein [Cladophialophora immunda]